MSARPGISLAALLAVPLLLSACTTPNGIIGELSGPYPQVCRELELSARRCAAIVAKAREEAVVEPGDIAAIELLRPARPAYMIDSPRTIVRFHLDGDRIVEDELFCSGVIGGYDIACGDDATISILAGVDRDVPCSGEPPIGCPTIPPTPPPDVARQSTPFELATLDVPIDHKGFYEIPLGSATLPNGYLSERSIALVDDRPATFWISAGWLVVRSDLAGRPEIGSRYRDAFDGLEPVTITLEFTVIEYDSPGVLRFRDIVVR